MNKSLRELGFTDEQLAAFSAALETTGATVFAPCATTARETTAYAALRLSDAEAAVVRASDDRQ
jgi:protein tyrosine phosphatase (PTP) superfamily phosphohydrolase (DUF442 family)